MIAFDTAPLIWGIQGRSQPGQENMIGRTSRYLEFLHADGSHKLIIPAPAAGEYLGWFDDEHRANQMAVLESRFRICAYDTAAMVVAAQIESNKQLMRELREADDITRQGLKIDTQILAVAIAQGAEKIVTSQADEFGRMAENHPIEVIEVPDIPKQLDLFHNSESDGDE